MTEYVYVIRLDWIISDIGKTCTGYVTCSGTLSEYRKMARLFTRQEAAMLIKGCSNLWQIMPVPQ